MRLLLFSLTIILAGSVFCQEDLYEVSFNEKVDSSTLIITGKVVSIISYHDSNTSSIFSDNTIEIYKIFEGSTILDTITVVTLGGNVGDQMTMTSSLLSLEKDDFGLFMCYQETGSSKYKVYASKQGFFKFDRSGDQATCPFYSSSVSELSQKIQNRTFTRPFEKKSITSPTYQSRSIGTSPCFSPSIITAGTGHVLTISGVGFGTVGPNSANFVAFADANDGGAPSFIQPQLMNYLTWSDTLIELLVPSRAGTGPILVETNGIFQESIDTLIVPFAIINSTAGNEVVLVDGNGMGGSNWVFQFSLFGTTTAEAFNRAVDTWKCATGVNWNVASTSTTISAPADDGVNIIAPMTLPAGVLGQCITHLSSCNGNNPYISGQDLVFSPTANWNFLQTPPSSSQIDFESVALHELGHALLNAHIVEPQDLMHFGISPGDSRRVLSAVNILAGNYVLDKSTFLNPCPAIAHVQNFPSQCIPPIVTDARLLKSSSVFDDSTCFGIQNVDIDFGNYGPDTLYNLDINWSVNGVMQTGVNWMGSLGLNNTFTGLNLGTVDLQDSAYQIIIWFSSQNGVQEFSTEGDTLLFNFHPVSCTPDDASVTLANQFDSLGCYSSEIIYCGLINSGENNLLSSWIYFSDGSGFTDSLFWSGVIAPGDTSAPLNLTTYWQFSMNNIFTIWTGLPNGVQDTYTTNDTIVHIIPILKLSGNYTIGGVNPDFSHPEDALEHLNNYGICGDIVLNIRPGIYSGGFVFEDFPMENSDDMVTLQSETLDSTDVILRSDSLNYWFSTLTFWETQNINVKHLTLERDSLHPDYRICWVTRNSNNINIENCHFGGGSNNTTKENIYVGDSPWGLTNLWSMQDLYFANNNFEGGKYGVSTSSINTDTAIVKNIRILKNHFSNIPYPINLENARNIEVGFNHTDSYSFPAVSLNYEHFGLDTAYIHHNYFFTKGPAKAITISSPQISGIVPLIFSNNSISHIERSNSTNASIEFDNVRFVNMINNSFYSKTGSGGNSNSAPIIKNGVNEVNGVFSLYNNQLVFDGNGRIFDHDGLSVNALQSDHNNFFTTGLMSSSTLTLIDHQANTGQDINSSFIDPAFLSEDTLIPLNIIGLDNQGVPWSNITDDIQKNDRALFTPDIGAYEFGGMHFDAALDSITQPSNYNCSIPGSIVSVIITNNHQDSVLTSATLNWSINGIPSSPYNWLGAILPNQSEEIVLGNYPFVSGENYQILVEISNPNALFDNVSSNDSINLNLLGNIEILGQNAICPSDSTLLYSSFTDSNAVYYWNNGATTSQIFADAVGLYTLSVTAYNCPPLLDTIEVEMFPPAVATFTIVNDTVLQSDILNALSYQWYFNGAPMLGQTSSSCTMLYDGAYWLEITNIDGCDAVSASHDFIAANVSVDAIPEAGFDIVPNPSSGMIQVFLPTKYCSILEIHDKFGRCIIQLYDVESEQLIFLDKLASGVYYVSITDLGTKRMIIIK